MKYLFIALQLLVFFITSSCFQNNSSTNGPSLNFNNSENESIITFLNPTNTASYKIGDSIHIELERLDKKIKIDSIRLWAEENKIIVLTDSFNYYWNTNDSKVGHIRIAVEVFSDGEIKQGISSTIILLSAEAPIQFKYKIINTYPHDIRSYTQGLVYDKGVLYESAGEYGISSLRKVNIETGKVIQVTNLESKYFAEGLAMYNEKLYQITWREQTCFVYDKKNLKQINQFKYDIAEGWGLASDSAQFIMSDGSSLLYFMNPELFTQVSKIEAMNNFGSVNMLNELEYVNGIIYANVYQTDNIVMIEAKSGKVVGQIDCSDLLKSSDKHPEIDVLNGIAYNSDNGHFYITGKNWPKLFEVIFQK